MKLVRRFIDLQNPYKRKFCSTFSKNKWKSVVGLEIHAQIQSRSKLFAGSSTEFTSPINGNVSLFDCAIPGTLPVLNKRCVEAGVLTALALNCQINPLSMFDRKHYFYADLPTGYQITQQRSPLAKNGSLEFQVYVPGIHKLSYAKQVRIKQIQLEQDSGRSLHESNRSLVDLNRAGIPLMELVFEPDLCDGEEAAALIKDIIIILQRLGTCSCKMEEGALRIDANVSVHQPGQPLGTRTEIKNIGSVRGVAGAIAYEVKRQILLLEEGKSIINETRSWDAASKVTVGMRDKEEKQDYRYMPEPNLPPLHISMGSADFGCVNADNLRALLPELPNQTRSRLKESYGLTLEQVIILMSEEKLLSAFTKALEVKIQNPKLIANLLIYDMLTWLNKSKMLLDNVNINGQYLGETARLLELGTINRQTARLLIEEMILSATASSPSEIVAARGLMQITNEEELIELCKSVLNENPKLVESYKKGKVKLFRAFMGQIAAKSEQKANMSKVAVILKDILDK